MLIKLFSLCLFVCLFVCLSVRLFLSFFLSRFSSTYSFYVWRLIAASDNITDARARAHTLCRSTLDEGSASRRGLYLFDTKHSQDTSMPPARFEPAFPVSRRPQTHGLNRVATGIGHYYKTWWYLK